MKGTFDLSGGAGFCNAVRRALLSDLEAWAPHDVTLRVNTSCQTDEYLAHRLGMIPFRRVGNGDEMTLRAQGPCTVHARDLTGPAFEAVHGNIEVLRLGPGQDLDLTVRFDRRRASVHARYAVVAGVGMERLDDATHRLRFETNDGSDPREAMTRALDALEERVQKALRGLANQPAVPPKSMC